MVSKSEEQMGQVMEDYNSFTVDFQESDKMLGGEALHPTQAATVVRVQDSKPVTTDAPTPSTPQTWTRP
jgi:hypothetical protein